MFGKYPFNQDIIYTSVDVTDENYTPQAFNTLLKQIQDPAPKTLTEQDDGTFGYAVFFVLKDGRVTASGPREEILPTLIGTQAAVRECRKNVVKKDEVGVC